VRSNTPLVPVDQCGFTSVLTLALGAFINHVRITCGAYLKSFGLISIKYKKEIKYITAILLH
jgi:hypothetical protein